MSKLTLIHTSPVEIEKITDNGVFGSFLFFSSSEYSMVGNDYIAYEIEIDESDIIEAGQLFYSHSSDDVADIIAELADDFDVDLETAEGLIDGSVNYWSLDIETDADGAWALQHYTAKAARKLGYRGVQVEDEQGTAYMIDMLGRESELKNR